MRVLLSSWSRTAAVAALCCVTAIAVAAARTAGPQESPRDQSRGDSANGAAEARGSAAFGRDVFRFETFGNEGFWTDAMRLPQGMIAAKVTPIQALQSGLMVDIDAVPDELHGAIAAELKTDLSPQNAPLLNDPRTTIQLIEANAIIGIVPKDSNGDGKIDLTQGDKIGLSCALCHAVTDKSVYNMRSGGSIGRRVDGPAALTLNVGKQLAIAANSRAYFPFLQTMHGGKTIGRASKGLTADSTEQEFDAYLTNPDYYPIGTFDDTPDGNGNPVVNSPLFRQDLAKPFGSAGEQASVVNFANGVYTVALDPTSLATPDGRKFLKAVGGEAGERLSKDYAQILADTGVTGYPYVQSKKQGKPGEPAHLVGLTVDRKKLADLQAYTESLQAPEGAMVEKDKAARGRKLFAASCTSCHNVDQSNPVIAKLIGMKTIWPGYRPAILAKRNPPLDPIQNAPGTFDDKMIVVDASLGGGKRGNAVPMLLDLDRKDMFLHDASVKGLDSLLDPSRGQIAPHPFYVSSTKQRDDVVQFLRGLDTGSTSR